MRAWRVHEFGEPADVLRLSDVDEPTGEMLRELRMCLGGWFPAGTPETYSDPYQDWVVMKMSLPDVTMARGYYPTPAQIIDFNAVPEALTALANRRTVGRIVVRC